ncbi:hypothetical protein B0H13DRAFT_1851486 [Mycena leptocephala]|nr:hypothetical protein B0H13DRAFT_1851486 [Mycena leptocephala]
MARRSQGSRLYGLGLEGLASCNLCLGSGGLRSWFCNLRLLFGHQWASGSSPGKLQPLFGFWRLDVVAWQAVTSVWVLGEQIEIWPPVDDTGEFYPTIGGSQDPYQLLLLSPDIRTDSTVCNYLCQTDVPTDKDNLSLIGLNAKACILLHQAAQLTNLAQIHAHGSLRTILLMRSLLNAATIKLHDLWMMACSVIIELLAVLWLDHEELNSCLEDAIGAFKNFAHGDMLMSHQLTNLKKLKTHCFSILNLECMF